MHQIEPAKQFKPTFQRNVNSAEECSCELWLLLLIHLLKADERFCQQCVCITSRFDFGFGMLTKGFLECQKSLAFECCELKKQTNLYKAYRILHNSSMSIEKL